MTQKQTIPSIWLGKAEGIEEILRSNPTLVNAFLSVLDQIEAEVERQETSQADYDNPSWAYKQADRNGARRAYVKIRSLFAFLQDKG